MSKYKEMKITIEKSAKVVRVFPVFHGEHYYVDLSIIIGIK